MNESTANLLSGPWTGAQRHRPRETRQDSARPNADCVVAGLEGRGGRTSKPRHTEKERGCDDGLLE